MQRNYFKYSALAFVLQEAVNAIISFANVSADIESPMYIALVSLAVLLLVAAIVLLFLGFRSEKR
jgi:phosphate starvation-inducible membrane PsiE